MSARQLNINSLSVFLSLFKPMLVPLRLKRPLFFSTLSAGFPSPADDHIESQLDLNEHLVQCPAATFYVRVAGESMIEAGILDGDILVVDRSREAKHDSIVVAAVNNELTVKRLYWKNNIIELRPENPSYPIIRISNDMELVIWGVVSGVTRKL